MTQPRLEEAAVITLHPTIWQQGPRMVFDVVIHEMTHAAAFYVHGGWGGHSSHDNQVWCGEVMRISPLIGLPGLLASPTKRFKEDGRYKRATPHGPPMNEIARWPQAFRSDDYFRNSEVPFQW